MFTCSHLAVRKLIEMTQSLGTEIVIEHNLLKPQYIPAQVSGRPHTDDFFSFGIILQPIFLPLVLI